MNDEIEIKADEIIFIQMVNALREKGRESSKIAVPGLSYKGRNMRSSPSPEVVEEPERTGNFASCDLFVSTVDRVGTIEKGRNMLNRRVASGNYYGRGRKGIIEKP